MHYYPLSVKTNKQTKKNGIPDVNILKTTDDSGFLRGGEVRLDEGQLDFLYHFKFLQRNIDLASMYPAFIPHPTSCRVSEIKKEQIKRP